MKTTIGFVMVIGLMATILVSCGPGATFSPEEMDTGLSTQAAKTGEPIVAVPTEPQEATLIPISPTQGITENMDGTQSPAGNDSTEVVKLAREDLVKRLGLPADKITVAAVIGQEFSTDAFYCRAAKDRIPKDESPAIISGFSILLDASGQRYEYHASGETIVYCRILP